MSWKSIVKKRATVKGDVVIVGIDVGKRSNVASTSLRNPKRPKELQFSNDRQGFNLLLGRIGEWKRICGWSDVIVGLESSGHYWEPLAYWLAEHGIKVVQVNPLHVKRNKETVDNSPEKTDRKDAFLIADLVEQGKYLTLVLPRGVFAELRQLVASRKRMLEELNTKLNHVHESVDRIFPEFGTVFKDLRGKTARYILRHFPLPDEIVSIGYVDLVIRLKRDCYQRLRKDKLKALWDAAMSSVGVREGLEAARDVLHDELGGLEGVLERLEGVESRIERLVAEIDEARYMLSVSGIGVMTVAMVLSETCGMRNYERASSVLKLAGLNLYEISSGQMKGSRHITKRGRSLLRQVLYFAAVRQAKRGSVLYGFYRSLVDQGKNKIKALIAVACKLVRLLFALVRDSRYYTEQRPCLLAVGAAA